MKHRLEAIGLSYSYTPSEYVLRDVSLAVETGQVTGIIGPNGAGKSTLLQLLCGLLETVTGEVRLNDRPLGAYSGRDRARVLGYMPQSVSPAFSLSVREVVALGRFPHLGPFGSLSPSDHAVVDACLVRTETVDFASRDFMSLSGGERQRVVLASVLAQESRILLLDEPTSSLDLPHEVAFFRQLRDLSAANLGVLVVTHDINMAARFCDQLVLLGADHGLVAHGDPESVLTEASLTKAYGCPLSVGVHPDSGGPFVTVPMDSAS